MKHHSTSTSKEETNQLVYSPEKDEFLGIEKFSDIFEILDKNLFQVDEKIAGEVIYFAQKYSNSGQ
jgi:hypothetical protein